MKASWAATRESAGLTSCGVYHMGCLTLRPNHIREGESSPGSLGVSIQNDHACWKSSPVSKHFFQSLLKVLTVASARPLLWAWLTDDCLWAMPLFLSQRLNSCEVRMPSPSVATTTGHVLLWNHVLSLAVVEAVEGGDSNLK